MYGVAHWHRPSFLPFPHQPIAGAVEAVDVLDLSVGAAATVLEAHSDSASPDLDAIAAEHSQSPKTPILDPIDVGRRTDRRGCPEHEGDVPMAAVAEAPGAHPSELVAAHRCADPPLGDRAHGQMGGLDQRHPPG